MQIDTGELVCGKLSDKNARAIDGFRSTSAELESYLKEDALRDAKRRTPTTHLVFYKGEEGKAVGYFTLVNDKIDVKRLDDNDLIEGYQYAEFPAMKIARLSTHKEYTEMGIGEHMLVSAMLYALEVTKYSGCNFITVDAKTGPINPSKKFTPVDFYRRYGFREVRQDAKRKSRETIPLYLNYLRLLKKYQVQLNLQTELSEWPSRE